MQILNNHAENSISVPDATFDEIMRITSGNAFKVYCLVYRNTYGRGTTEVKLTLNDFCNKCGIASKKTVKKAIRELISLYLLNYVRRGFVTSYHCNVLKRVNLTE